MLIYTYLINSVISHEEFVLINNDKNGRIMLLSKCEMCDSKVKYQNVLNTKKLLNLGIRNKNTFK